MSIEDKSKKYCSKHNIEYEQNCSKCAAEQKEALRLIRKLNEIEKDKTLEKMTFSLIQKAFLLCTSKIAILLGANRSGKSEVLSCDALIRMLGIIPTSLKGEYPETSIRPGEYWTACVDFNSITDIIKKKFDRIGPERFKGKYNKEEKKQLWHGPKGDSEQRYKSYDSGREKFQGTSKVYVSFDEESPQDVWDEAYMRTVDCRGVMRGGYTPIKGMTWGHSELYQKASKWVKTENIHGIQEGQGLVHTKEEIKKLKERRLIEIINTSPEADPDIVIFQMTIYDNIHLPDIEIWKAERKYQHDPANYNARILGGFTKLTGNNVYPYTLLDKRMKQLDKIKFWRGTIDDKNMFQLSSKGNLILFIDPKEVRNRLFVIGADIATGIEGGDYSCAQILDHKTGEQVGIWWGHVDPGEFARILYRLGKFFNMAWVAPERNFHGIQVVDLLRNEYKYGRLWAEYHDDTQPENSRKGTRKVKRWGFLSTEASKEIITAKLKKAIVENRIRLNDVKTIDELITVIYKKDRKIGAMAGCHDDRERALAIAWHVWRDKRPKPYMPRTLRRSKRKTLGEVRNYGRPSR